MIGKQFVDMSDIVKLAKDEIVLKTYEGFDITEPAGKGFFSITNHRFIYYSNSSSRFSNSKSILEWDINSINGISSEYGKRVNTTHRLISIIIMGLSGAGFFYFLLKFLGQQIQDNLVLYASTALFVLGFIIFLFRKRKMFSIEIFSSAPKVSIVSFSSTFFKSQTSGKIQMRPNKFTIQMIKEIGETIIEAKQYQKY